MRTLLIAYSGLQKADYATLAAAIEGSGKYWWHHLDSVWIVKSTETAEAVGDKLGDLVSKMDPSPTLLVIEITNHYEGWLPEQAWEWMYKHVGSPSKGS